jgi:hypothetical protein
MCHSFGHNAAAEPVRPELWLCSPTGTATASSRCHDLLPVPQTPAQPQADARIRTGDPFITSEVLYQLSYVGGSPDATVNRRGSRQSSDATRYQGSATRSTSPTAAKSAMPITASRTIAANSAGVAVSLL